ncbi:MAG: sensor histidine kinase [Usitatibacter sp.]
MSTHSLIREPSKPEIQDAGVAGRLAELGEQISLKLGELELALKGANPEQADKLGKNVAELRALVSRQAALQDSLAEQIESQVAQRTRELASLSNFLQMHAEHEKAALARELHDALGGILTPAKMDLSWLESRLGNDPDFRDRMLRLSRMIDQGIDLKRRIIENLRPSLIDHLGLASALRWHIEEVCRDSHLDCRLHISDKLERLPADLEITLYRVVQEGVTNIVKHAKASRVELNVDRVSGGLEIVIADNGVGIADLDRAKSRSQGLAGMIHRVRCINGVFEMHSQPGKGTRIRVFVPL